MTIDEDIAFLVQVPTLRGLGAPALRMLAIGAESRFLEAGSVLFAAGDDADCAYVVQSGSFTLRPQHAVEGELMAGPGTLLGESALLTEVTRPATATARESSTVMRISRAMFLKMLEGYPDAALRLHEVLSVRADQWARDIESVLDALSPAAKGR
jgi:CRP-like cAMP-binding protein